MRLAFGVGRLNPHRTDAKMTTKSESAPTPTTTIVRREKAIRSAAKLVEEGQAAKHLQKSCACAWVVVRDSPRRPTTINQSPTAGPWIGRRRTKTDQPPAEEEQAAMNLNGSIQ
jgi:hypothetical protein